MTYEQLLQLIRANAINYTVIYSGAEEQTYLVPFYHAPITEAQHLQILEVLREQGVALAAAIWLNKVEVCIDQANHAPFHYYVGHVQAPHSRCRACERIREDMKPKTREALENWTLTLQR